MINKKDIVIKTDVRRFIPFRKGNALKKFRTDFQVKDKTLRMRATSAFYPLVATIVESIYDKESYRNGFTLYKEATGDGYSLLCRNDIDILFSTEPSESQRKSLIESGREYEFVPILMEPLAIILNKENSVNDLTTNNILDLYLGKIKNWKELGGPDLIVRTYQLTDGNGSHTCFTKLLRKTPLDINHKEVPTMPGIIDDVADYPGAICYAFWSYFTKMYSHACAKMIKVNGYTAFDSGYPLQHPIYMIFGKDNPNMEIQRIREFLTSDEGQVLVKEANQIQRDYGEDL